MNRFLFFFCGAVFFFLCFISSGFIESVDGMLYAAVAQNIARTGKPDAPEYGYPEKNIHLAIFTRKDGKPFSPTGLGYSLALTPAAFLSDTIHRWYGVPLVQNFPLETDFFLHFFGSFTNAFFGATFVFIFAKYLKEYQFDERMSALLALACLFGTNLLPYAKHSFAHMMFACFLTGTFYALKKTASSTHKVWYLLAGFFFGLTIITYNISFALAVPALFTYWFLLHKKNFKEGFIENLATTILGASPFLLIFLLNNIYRTGSAADSGYGFPAATNIVGRSLRFTFEGLWGQFLSPGRSLFLYSPILALPIIFWHKLPIKKYQAEFASFVLLLLTYTWTYAAQVLSNNTVIWHGELSWGPRYLTPLIPPLFLLSILTARQLQKKTAVRVVVSLLALGFLFQLPGIISPYQIKFAGLPQNIYLETNRLLVYDYANFIPRLSPLFTQTRNMAKALYLYPKTLMTKSHKAEFYDGFYVPDNMNAETLLQVKNLASLRWQSQNASDEVSLQLQNFQDDKASTATAALIFTDGEKTTEHKLLAGSGSAFLFQTSGSTKNLQISYVYEATTAAKQNMLLSRVSINGEDQNMARITLPYIDPLLEKISGHEYGYWGKENQQMWDWWQLRSRVYEISPDFWWVRNFYYWDVSKWFLLPIFALNILGFAYCALKSWSLQKR